MKKPKTGIGPENFMITDAPFYLATGNEISLFEAAYADRLPMMLKGPTGCGKTRFVEHMAFRLKRPLITVACNEDMTASDLVGRFLLDKEGTKWQDGPLTTAVKAAGIAYLDEVVEARQDTTVVIHPLTDDRPPVHDQVDRRLHSGQENSVIIGHVRRHPDQLLGLDHEMTLVGLEGKYTRADPGRIGQGAGRAPGAPFLLHPG